MKTFKKLVTLHPLILYQEDFVNLGEILNDCLSLEKDNLEIEVNVDDSVLTEKSFEKLFSHSLPKQTDDISILARRHDQDHYDYVSVTLDNFNAHYYITSYNDTWFYGTISKLNRFLLKHKPWYSFLHNYFSFIVGAFIALSVFGVVLGILNSLVLLITISSLSLILVIYMCVLWFRRTIFPRVKLFLTTKPERKVSIELIIVILDFSILIATLASIIVSLKTTN